MPPTWTEITSAIATSVAAASAALAAVFAWHAWQVAARTYQGSFRPVLRPVPKRYGNGGIAPDVLVLKNIGRGPAISVMLVEPEPPAGQQWPPTHPGPIAATADVVEPLGAPRDQGGEESRIGRVEMHIPTARMLRQNITYRLLYQDLTARWHETTFSIIGEDQATKHGLLKRMEHLSTRYLGPLGGRAVRTLPKEVRSQMQIVHDRE